MNRKGIDLIRILAVFVILSAIVYYYSNIAFLPLIPKSLRIGVIRKPFNILILGTDITFDAETSKPMPHLKGRADTILLARIDPINSRINILSIPRDTCVEIPGYGMKKINAANAYGGIPLIKKTVANLTGQKIDYYLEVKPTAVTKIVDILGGVYLDVEKDMRYVDRAQKLNINLKKGYQKLSGKQAQDYIRFRKDIKGDIGRIGRQQKFLKALTRAMIEPTNVFRAPFVIRAALREIKTDMPFAKLIRILNWSRALDIKSIKTAMPLGDAAYVKGAGSVWILEDKSLKETVEELF